jgi:hypothetical protein
MRMCVCVCVCVCKKGQPTNSAFSLLPAQPQLVISLCRFLRLYFKHALRLYLTYYFTGLSATLLVFTCLTRVGMVYNFRLALPSLLADPSMHTYRTTVRRSPHPSNEPPTPYQH